MPSRSGMAAATLVAMSMTALAGPARAAAGPVVNQVALELQIAGLSQGSCELEIKPGHAGCQFKKVVRKVTTPGSVINPSGRITVDLDPIVARSTNADRDCTFAITIKEPGQKPQTIHRGLRLTPQVAGAPMPSHTLTVYLSSPSLAAREGGRPRR